jgi:hypothetical protein
VGALLNVARCNEQAGKTATAWAEYRAAATLAAQRNEEERRRGAQELANQLEARLSRLSVEVSPQFPNVSVRVDSQQLPSVSFGIPLPMDPGEHLLEATARGYEPWVQKIPVSGEGSRTTVLVPELKERALDAAAGRGRVIAGAVLGSLGAAALAGGAVQAVRAYQQDRALENACATPDRAGARACGSAKQSDIDRLAFTANSATVLLASGGAVATAGVALLFAGRMANAAAEEGATNGLLLVPVIAPSSAGLSLIGAF